MNRPSRTTFYTLREAFLHLDTVGDLCALFRLDELELNALALQPPYNEFKVPKKNGELRLIEDPAPQLKAFQDQLNDFLQGVYYFQRSKAAYGFLAACADDPPDDRRDIVHNARRHLGRPWLLNMDIEDFFHAITADQVAWMFLSDPFHFKRELAGFLMRLCTYKGRLPMGAPSSPILSNFAARQLDEDLEALAEKRGWLYTRYADDMSFSSEHEITQADVELLRGYYRAHDFEPNERKTKLMGPADAHIVTGILLTDHGLDLEPSFFKEVNKEIRELTDVASVKGRLGISLSDWVEDYADNIQGMISFAEQVLGRHHIKVKNLQNALEQAKQRPKDFGSLSWLKWPYR